MQIAHATTDHYRWDLPRPIGDANGVTDVLTLPVTTITTDDGHTGTSVGGSPGATAAMTHLLSGLDASGVREAARVLRPLAFKAGLGSDLWASATAIENALWDLKAQAADQPLWRLLGAHQGDVQVYASALGVALSDDELFELYRQFAQRGVTMAKVKVRGDLTADLRRIEIVEGAVASAGSFDGLMIDINESMTPKAALAFANAVHAAHPLLWVEEPTARDDLGQLRWMRDRLRSHLATGENLPSARQLSGLLAAGACDIIQLGGMLSVIDALAVSDIAGALDIAASVVSIEGHTLAHVAAATGHRAPYELKFLDPPEFLQVDHVIDGGYLRLAATPGVGFRLSDDADRHRPTTPGLADPNSPHARPPIVPTTPPVSPPTSP